MAYETIEIKRDGAVATLTINRPAVMNALNAKVFQEMLHFLADTQATSGLRALVLTGAGDKAFIAGADIAAMQTMSPGEAMEFSRLGQTFTQRLEEQNFVTIARVQGYALGGGCEVAMACDFIVASENALFGQPEVDLGLIPGFGGTQRLARRVGLPVAMEMLVAGRKLSGKEALQFGLASTVVEAAELDNAIQKVIKNVLKAAPHAIAETKRLTRASLEQPLAAGLSAESTAFATAFAYAESREGIQAFLEKRKAKF